jgi:hypothetical protein
MTLQIGSGPGLAWQSFNGSEMALSGAPVLVRPKST